MAQEFETGDRPAKAPTADAPGRLVPLAPGLHFIATPIGAARDITLRALDILRSADLLVAEDTRSLRHLMEIHGVPLEGRRVLAYHDHNGAQMRPRVMAALHEGKSVAYASEAGTPLVADPGFQLGRAALAEDLPVFSAPGPSAVLAALTVSGLPSDRFLFAGFAPNASMARQKWLAGLRDIPATLIFYESPKRIQGMLRDCVKILGESREAALCRELTKKFEETRRGTLGALADGLEGASVKGEIVLLVDRAQGPAAGPEELEAMLRQALAQQSLKDAVSEVSNALGLPRRDVYQAALALEKSR